MKHSLPSEPYFPKEELVPGFSGQSLAEQILDLISKEENIDKAVDEKKMISGPSQHPEAFSQLTWQQEYQIEELGVHDIDISTPEDSTVESKSESSSVCFSVEPSTFRTSPQRPPFGFHSIHSDRITTTSSFWPFKEAEDRVKSTCEESLICSRLLRKYKNKVSRRFEPLTDQVPWNLMDELQVEKLRWETEKSKMQEHIVKRMIKGPKTPLVEREKAANQVSDARLSNSEEG